MSQSSSRGGTSGGHDRARPLVGAKLDAGLLQARGATAGRNADAMPAWTSRVSMALHTLTRCAFAFSTTATAMSRSAPSST